MAGVAVSVEEVSKRFRLYHERSTNLKDRVLTMGRSTYEDLWALRDVSFEVPEGETLGILGHNGSGKSTLLKCICGVLQPTEGQVVARGKLAGLLELGAGFQPELSGRDNVYLNASMLGLTKREVDRVFDDVVAFSELEPFIDNQVKFYSSGMYVRLGFAVAVNVDPDILVVDEVLAVGDERFQRKCLDRIRQFQEEGRTIIVVTHSAEQIKQICDKAVVLSHGAKIGEGTPGTAVQVFRASMLEEEIAHDHPELQEHGRLARIDHVRVEHGGPEARGPLRSGDPVSITISYSVTEPIVEVVFDLELHAPNGTLLFKLDSRDAGKVYDLEVGSGEVRFDFPVWPLGDGAMKLSVGIQSRRGGQIFDWLEDAGEIEVATEGARGGVLTLPVSVTDAGAAAARR